MENLDLNALVGQWLWLLVGAVTSAVIGVTVKFAAGLMRAPEPGPLAGEILKDLTDAPVEPTDSESGTDTDRITVCLPRRHSKGIIYVKDATGRKAVEDLLSRPERARIYSVTRQRVKRQNALHVLARGEKALQTLSSQSPAGKMLPAAQKVIDPRYDADSLTCFSDVNGFPVTYRNGCWEKSGPARLV